MTFDHVSSEGDVYDLLEVVKRVLDQGARKRFQGGANVACIIHVQSEELTLEYHLKLMVGRTDEFYMKGGKVAVQDGTPDDDLFRHWNERLSVHDHKKSLTSNGERTEIALNILNISKLL